MNFLSLISDFEESNKLRRCVVGSRISDNLLSYETTASDVSIKINDTTYSDLNRLCFQHDATNIYLYINNLTRRNLNKINISSIETVLIT